MDNFNFTAPSTALTAAIREVRLIAASDPYLARAAAADELVFRIYIDFQDQDSGGIGKILLNKDFNDSRGNSMIDNFEMRIQIQKYIRQILKMKRLVKLPTEYHLNLELQKAVNCFYLFKNLA